MPVIMFRIVDLPLPDGPTTATSSPGGDREVDAAQRSVVDLPHPVDLLDAGELDQRRRAELRVRPGRGTSSSISADIIAHLSRHAAISLA